MARQLPETDEENTSGEYYRSVKGTAVPVRWTAAEALEERKYTEKRCVSQRQNPFIDGGKLQARVPLLARAC